MSKTTYLGLEKPAESEFYRIQHFNDNADIIDKKVHELENKVGSPFIAQTAAQMTDKTRVYVYVGSESGYTKGNWYYHNGSKWISGGVYNSQGVDTDKNLDVEGKAADAKATGDRLSSITEDLKNSLSANGVQTFAIYAKFEHANLQQGKILRNIKYRIATDDLIKVDRDITIEAKNGFRFGVHTFVNGNYEKDSGWINSGKNLKISNGSTFKIVISRIDEDTSEDANMQEFVNAIIFNNVINDIKKELLITTENIKNNTNKEKTVLINNDNLHGTLWIYSDFVNGGLDGVTPVAQFWRVYSVDIIEAPYDLIITVDSLHKILFRFYINNEYDKSKDKEILPNQSLRINQGERFKCVIANYSETKDIADINEFVNAIKIDKNGVSSKLYRPNPCMMSISHQGFSTTNEAFGNSRISSYRGTFDRGFECAETDIQWTADNIPVCCHDNVFVNTDNDTTVTISENTYNDLKNMGYYHETIATFDDVIKNCKIYGLKLEIDKTKTTWTDTQWKILFDIISKYQMKEYVIWTCINGEMKNKIFNFYRKSTLMLNCNANQLTNAVSTAKAWATDDNKIIIAVNTSGLREKDIAEANVSIQGYNINIGVWTIDDVDEYKRWIPYAYCITSNKYCAKDIVY